VAARRLELLAPTDDRRGCAAARRVEAQQLPLLPSQASEHDRALLASPHYIALIQWAGCGWRAPGSGRGGAQLAAVNAIGTDLGNLIAIIDEAWTAAALEWLRAVANALSEYLVLRGSTSSQHDLYALLLSGALSWTGLSWNCWRSSGCRGRGPPGPDRRSAVRGAAGDGIAAERTMRQAQQMPAMLWGHHYGAWRLAAARN